MDQKTASFVLTGAEAARLRSGQRVTPGEPGALARLDRLKDSVVVGAWHDQILIALARIEGGRLRPIRVINR